MQELLITTGYLGIFAIIFAESGLLIGFFLPGDSLLFTAGFLASLDNPVFSLPILCVLCCIAAVLGDNVGYAFGHRIGRKLFQKEDSLLFSKNNLLKAESFYEKYGGRAIILARFIPIVRTFAPIVAGIGTMNYRRFVAYNLIGGTLWTIGISCAGYALGHLIPNVDRYLLPIVILIIIVSVLPNVYHILESKENRDALLESLKKIQIRILAWRGKS